MQLNIDLTMNGQQMVLSVREAQRVLATLQRQLHRTGDATSSIETHFGRLGTKLRHTVIIAMAARYAFIDIYDIFIRLPKAIIETAGEIERLQKLMMGLSDATTEAGRNLEARENLKMLFDLARSAPYQVKGLADAFVKLKSGGLDPTRESMVTLTDALAKFGGNDDIMHRAAIALQQMAGKGVISMEELRQQLGEAVPTALRSMAAASGKTVDEFAKLVSRGTVEAKLSIRNMFLLWEMQNAGAARKMMDTWPGLLSRLKTEWQLFADGIAQSGFIQAIKGVAQSVLGIAQSDDTQEWGRAFGLALANAARHVQSIVEGFKEMWPTIKMIGSATIAMWSISMMSQFMNLLRKITMSGWVAYKAELVLVAAAHKKLGVELNALAAERSHAAYLEVQKLKAMETTLNAMSAKNATKYGALLGGGTVAQIAAMQQAVIVQRNVAAAAEKAANGLNAQAKATKDVTAFTKLKTGAVMALGGVLTALGGWAGVAITVLAGLAYAWANLTLKTDDATEALNEYDLAMQGFGAKDRINQVTLAIAASETKIAAWQRQIAQMENEFLGEGKGADAMRAYYKERIESLRELIDKERNLIRQREQTRILDKNNLVRKEVADTVALYRRGIDDELRLINDKSARTIQAANEEYEKKKELAGKSEALARKAAEEHTAVLKKEGIERANATLALFKRVQGQIERELAEARKKLGSGPEAAVRVSALEAASADIAKSINASRQTIYDFEKGFGKLSQRAPDVTFTGPSPIERMISDKKSEIERITEQLRGMDDGVRSMTDIYAEFQKKYLSMWELGTLVDKGVDANGKKATKPATKDEVLLLANLAAQEEIVKKALAMQQRLLQMDQSDSVEYENALRRLLNPLSPDILGSNALSTDRQLAKIETQLRPLEEFLASKGIKFSELMRRIRSSATVQDLDTLVTPLVEKTREINLSLIDDTRERARKELEIELTLTRAKIEALAQVARQRGDASAILAIEAALKSFDEYSAARAAQVARDTETPLQRLGREWTKTTEAMEQATAKWAESAIDYMVEFAKTGKFEFHKFTLAVLEDILRIQLKAKLAGPMSEMLGGFGNWILKTVGLATGTSGAEHGALANQMNAMGNVMTPFGPAHLRRYARGGIAMARRPQIAIFGEGSMNEAYVPLPDGRRIPVAMQGAMPNVEVNVINQTGIAANAQQQGGPRFDGKRMILDVVMTAAAQPGPFREGMRTAMK